MRVILASAWVLLSPRHAEAQRAATPEMRLEQGRLVYAKTCAACHGIVLEGTEFPRPDKAGKLVVPALNDSTTAWRHSDLVLYGIVRYGEHVLASKTSPWMMPGFRYRLTSAETWIVIDYVKSTWSEETRQRQIEASIRLRRTEERLEW
jgi:mono/diheme cytochrome c family protein